MSFFKHSLIGRAIGKATAAIKQAAAYVTNKDGRRKPVQISSTNVEADDRLVQKLDHLVTGRLSRRERVLPWDVYKVKRKLGRSYFTRHLGLRMRTRRLQSLTRRELGIAQAYGWL